MQVPYVDLPKQNGAIREALLEAVARVIDHGGYILGHEVEAFEQALGARLGIEDVVGVSNGTDALVLALRGAGVQCGDEVITVSHSFVATATAIKLVGAVPVYVDVDDRTMLMDPSQLEGALTERTKAVMPVHLNGHPADITAIAAFCEQNGLALVEDCAQAIGATHAGKSVGSVGIGAWSMHPLKVLSALGDAGFVTHGPPVLREWRNLGLVGRGVAGHVAGNTRLDAIHAAMLGVKLPLLDGYIEARRAHAAAYREALGDVVVLPPAELPGERCVYSAFVVRHPRRDELVEALHARGVDAKIHYPTAIHQMAPFKESPPPHLPVTERVVSEIVSLPVTPELTVEGRNQVIAAVLEASGA